MNNLKYKKTVYNSVKKMGSQLIKRISFFKNTDCFNLYTTY